MAANLDFIGQSGANLRFLLVITDQLALCRIVLTCFTANAQIMEEIEREAYVTSAHCGTVTLAAMEMYRKEVGAHILGV